MTKASQASYMAQALELAEKGRFSVSPNPLVGCLIVQNNQVVGKGWHQRAGGPHAEVFALAEAGILAQGATAYVTLEPCCHTGRTPPCTEALIAAGIREVQIACLDPNPLVAGKGVQALRAAGITVKAGLYEQEAKALNEIFFHFIQYRRPFVISKWAMSLDGKTVTSAKDSPQISSPESQAHTHELRQAVDAILVGSQTALQDNPALTARINDQVLDADLQPLRIVLSSRGTLPLHLRLFDESLPGQTLVVTTEAAEKTWCSALQEKGVEVLCLPSTPHAQISLPELLDELGKREITSLLVEGGSTVQASFFKEGLVNKIQVYLAPTLIASFEKKKYLNPVHCRPLGCDFSFSVNI